MGGHYGSVQLHTDDRQRVKQAAEQVARAKGIKCLVGPALNGWVGVYPENNGQDEKVGEEIARRVGGEAIHLVVHDDDIFAYWFWRDGKLIDSFWSKPGYFGAENVEAEEAMTGKPQMFAHLVGDRLEELRKLLDRDEDYVFEYERLMQFGELMGISNAVAAYEYIKSGETDDIESWDEFEELPEKPLTAKPAPKRKKLTPATTHPALIIEQREIGLMPTAAQQDNDFLVTWTGSAANRAEIYRLPWTGPEDADLGFEGPIWRPTFSADGMRLAVGRDEGLSVLSMPERDRLLNISLYAPVSVMTLNTIGDELFYAAGEDIVGVKVDGGKRMLNVPANGTRVLAIHPSERWLVAGGNSVLIIRLREPRDAKELFVGGRAPGTVGSGRQAASFVIRADTAAAALREQHAYGAELLNSLGITEDGLLLWCCTSKGIRVYRWEEVVGAQGEDMPAPKWSYDYEKLCYAYAGVEERPKGDGIVFGGSDGSIRRIDLHDGHVRLLVDPSEAAVSHLLMSANGESLGTCRITMRIGSPAGKSFCAWEIWSYPRLLAAAT